MNDRVVRILDILSANKNIKVNLLAEILDVSQATLRKDLDKLEKKGMICRSHGYASLDGANDTGKRIAINHSIKRKIAKAAAQIIEDGETIMIESGSCCTLFAEELTLTKKNITVITNSVFISNYIGHTANIKIILLGGFFQPDAQVTVGPITAKCAETFFCDKFFIGTDGFIEGTAFTGKDHLRATTAQEMAEYAKKIFILTEADKFLRRGACSLLPLNKITGVFTDNRIPKEAEEYLIQNNINLYKSSP